MRYELTVDGVPVGHAFLTGGRRAAGRLIPLSAFAATGLAAVASQFGAALLLLGEADAAPPGGVTALTTALLQQPRWSARLELRDARGAAAAVGRITVVCFPDGEITVIAETGIQAAPVTAPPSPCTGNPGAEQQPAA